MIVGTMTSKGQTTVPKIVRDELGLAEGSRIEWELRDGGAFIKLRSTRRAIDLAGMLGTSAVGAIAVEEMDEALGRTLAEDDERISREWHDR